MGAMCSLTATQIDSYLGDTCASHSVHNGRDEKVRKPFVSSVTIDLRFNERRRRCRRVFTMRATYVSQSIQGRDRSIYPIVCHRLCSKLLRQTDGLLERS